MLIIGSLAQLPFDLPNHFNPLKKQKTKPPWLQGKRKERLRLIRSESNCLHFHLASNQAHFPLSKRKKCALLPLSYQLQRETNIIPNKPPCISCLCTRLLFNRFFLGRHHSLRKCCYERNLIHRNIHGIPKESAEKENVNVKGSCGSHSRQWLTGSNSWPTKS